MNTQCSVAINFLVPENRINANTLANSVLHTCDLLHQINSCIYSNKKIKVHVHAFEPGSFIIHIELSESLIEAAKSMFTPENVVFVDEVVKLFIDFIRLKKFLKGKEPKGVDNKGSNEVIVKNYEDKSITINNPTYNININNEANKSLDGIFSSLEKDPDIKGCKVSYDNKQEAVIREEFPYMTSSGEEVLDETKKTTVKEVQVTIERISFEKKLASNFEYRGKRISAKIEDNDFFKEKIEKREPFAKGDKLMVTMTIESSCNIKTPAKSASKHTITKVHNHTKEGVHIELSLIDENNNVFGKE